MKKKTGKDQVEAIEEKETEKPKDEPIHIGKQSNF